MNATSIKKELDTMNWSFFILGGLLMMLFTFGTLVKISHPVASRAQVGLNGYMEYHGDLRRHFIFNYWCEFGTKFDDGVPKVDELSYELQSRSDKI